MTLKRNRLLDLSKQSTAFPASLRKSVAELEAQAAVARSQADAQIAAAFRHADDFKRQVQNRDQEIASLRISIAEHDRAYEDLQGVASKHFAQLQGSAWLLVDGGSQPLRHAQSVIAHQRAVILRQQRLIARQGSIPMHDPHTAAAAAAGGLDAPGLSPSDLQLNARSIGLTASEVDSAGGSSQLRRTLAQLRRARLNTLTPAEKLRRLSHSVSATAAGSRRKPHQPPDQPYSTPLPGEEGHEEVMELLAGDDLGAVPDGELLRLSAASSRRRRHRRRASSSVTPSSAARVGRSASAAGVKASFDFDLGDPMEDVKLDASAEMGASATSSTGAVSTTGTSSVVAATSSPVTATSSTTVTTVVSTATAVDSAVVSYTAPQDSSISTATSSSAAAASSSAMLVSMSSCSAESASADSSVPTSLPIAFSAAGLSAAFSTASTIGLASSAGLDVSTSISLLAPLPTSGVVTPAPSSAGPVVASAPVLSSALTPEPSSSSSLVTSSTASSTVMSTPASSSAVITASVTSSAAVALPAAGSVGVSTSCPPALKPSGVASTVVAAVPEVSSTSTRPTVPVSDSVLVSPFGQPRRKSAAIVASLSSHYLTELSVSDRVTLGLGGSAEYSSNLTSRRAGSSAKPLELLSGSSDPESDSVAASWAENESSRGQTGDHGDQATTVPHPEARALSFATPTLDGDDSSDDSDDISPRDLVSRIQTGRVAMHGKARSYLALGRTPPSSPRSSDSAGALSAQQSSSFPKKTKEKNERRKHKHRHTHKHKSKRRHKHKRRLSELEDSSDSAGDADRPRRSKRLASSDPAGRPRPSKKNHRDLPPRSSRLSDHSASASPVVPSSLPSTPASVGVTAHSGVHSTPALPAVLRVSVKLGRSSGLEGGRSRIPPTPSSLDGLRAFADVYNPDHPSQLLKRLLPASPMFVSPLRLSEARTRLGNSVRASSLMERLAELWVKLRGAIPSPTKLGNSVTLVRDDHPTRYFVALWERTHLVVEAGVMMSLHPSQQGSRS
ncbi:unnamed protein product [Phytophthora fragariaefolia]|uniref:Unnamed protein product n=1 Tax=Phytophthora fragariaefolia TaxID=1490495 RepID=A0A9W6U0V2_9STRA|nr:unnamed protein product [Phytophthora fragariaefolia]